MCFQILGFDIMLDEKLKPWLLEVNQSPSFGDDTPLDTKIKSNLIADTFKLLHLTKDNRNKHNLMRNDLQSRFHGTPYYKNEVVQKREQLSKFRDIYE